MNEEIHILIVGLIYIGMTFPIWLRNRENRYDRGYQWIFFSLAHGLDEVFDYLAGITKENFYNLHIIFEKLELATFFLSATFLLLASLVKMGKINSDQTFTFGFYLPSLIVIYILSFDEAVLDSISALFVTIGDFNIKYTTIVFGVIAAIPLIITYSYEFIHLTRKTIKLKNFNSKQVFFSLITAILFILYIIGEVFSSTYILLVYLEVFTIITIMLSPLEVILDNNLQLFLVYDIHGIPVMNVKFNTGITDDVAILVSGFLTAINSMISNELNIGNLSRIMTQKGLLLSEYNNQYIFSLLVNEDKTIEKNLDNFQKVIKKITGKLPEEYIGYIDNESELEKIILSTFIN